MLPTVDVGYHIEKTVIMIISSHFYHSFIAGIHVLGGNAIRLLSVARDKNSGQTDLRKKGNVLENSKPEPPSDIAGSRA